eukprot:Nitzschia sp. Nitz4//scaffold13_size275219//226814//227824//NITZ4_000913-RA/size275219-processed-gene-0.109-mRNA-1//1//CDS//3329536131//2544//frame0
MNHGNQTQRPVSNNNNNTISTSPRSSIPKWKDAIAGAIAGAISKTALAPVERVKLLVQLQGSVQGIAGQTPWKVALHVYQQEGVWAFWRGNAPNVWRSAGQAALTFSLLESYKSTAHWLWEVADPTHPSDSNSSLQRWMVSFFSGGLAGATSTTVLYPLEYARTRLATDQGRSMERRQFRGMSDVLVRTVQMEGIMGLYHGYSIALWGSVVYRLLFLGGYDALKAELQWWKKSNRGLGDSTGMSSLTWTERMIMAQSVSLVAGTLCYPIDSVRRRLMMQAGSGNPKYRGTVDCIRSIWRNEGHRGFFLGLTPNLVRSVGGALMLVAYDAVKGILES